MRGCVDENRESDINMNTSKWRNNNQNSYFFEVNIYNIIENI